MKHLLLLFAALCGACVLRAQNLSGTWQGELQVGRQKLELFFHFDGDGPTVKMDVPAQGLEGLPVAVRKSSPEGVELACDALRFTYAGKMENGVLKGTFTQHGMAFPLELVRGERKPVLRPQEPESPCPYRTEEVSFRNVAARATLAATLTYPVGWKPGARVPVVLMVSGSGLQNRDEEIFGHRPFLVLADYLARHGIASLRYDDRGTGRSTGEVADCTTEDFADDAEQGLVWLARRGDFSKVGVLGHSEGGIIAFMLGARSPHLDFIVSLAGMGIRGDSLLNMQLNGAAARAGMTGQRSVADFRAEFFRSSQARNPWMRFFVDYDPAGDVRRVKLPVMAVNGERDRQVEATGNLEALRRLLAEGDRRNLIRSYPGLNHLFQHCHTGDADEYHAIEETFSEEVMADIVRWIGSL